MITNILIIAQLALAYLSFQQESAGKATGYSKFRENGAQLMDTKQAMLRLYSVPAVTAFILLLTEYFRFRLTTVSLFISFAFALHFSKRVAEVQFIHKYSGGMDKQAALTIGIVYTMDVILTHFLSYSTPIHPLWFLVGHTILIVGLLGNAYHHYLLSTLRSGKDDSGNKNYSLPTGGLFDYLVTPHYTFEILGYVGIWIASGFDAYFGAVMIRVTCYLTGRSIGTKQWYLEKMPEEKAKIESRKLLIPNYF
jgi:hypothetical protein